MNQNPMLLATLFLKHQPAAKTFEEAVAMEVESLKSEWVKIDEELSVLAAKEKALLARKNEILDTRRELLGEEQAVTITASTAPEPAKHGKSPAPTLFQLASRKPRDRKARLRTRKGTNLTERRYMNCKYVEMAIRRAVGTVESNEIVWLTTEEHGPVYADVCAARSGAPPAPVTELVWDRNIGRGHPLQVRIREGTGEVERSYSGHDYVGWARATGKGSPGIGCVYLTSEEADTAVKSRKARESRQSAAAK